MWHLSCGRLGTELVSWAARSQGTPRVNHLWSRSMTLICDSVNWSKVGGRLSQSSAMPAISVILETPSSQVEYFPYAEVHRNLYNIEEHHGMWYLRWPRLRWPQNFRKLTSDLISLILLLLAMCLRGHSINQGKLIVELRPQKLILYCTKYMYFFIVTLSHWGKCLLLILWILLTVDYFYFGFYTTVILEICCFILTFLVKILLSHNG